MQTNVPRASSERPAMSQQALRTDNSLRLGVERCAAVITVSGALETEITVTQAQSLGKPVVPLAATGGYSAEVFKRMMAQWPSTPALPHVTFEQFKELQVTTVDGQMRAVLDLLRSLFHPPAAPATPGAIYVSYAREDAEAAMAVLTQLQALGITVWMDKTILQAGSVWQAELDRALQTCALFMPLLSRHTTERRDGLFRREWDMALERQSRLGRDRIFIVPLVVGERFEASVHDVPKQLAEIHWSHAPRGQLMPELLERLRTLLRQASNPPENQASPNVSA